jgi:hypothetical protein
MTGGPGLASWKKRRRQERKTPSHGDFKSGSGSGRQGPITVNR